MRPDGTEWDLGAGSFGKVVKGLVNGEQVLTHTSASAPPSLSLHTIAEPRRS